MLKNMITRKTINIDDILIDCPKIQAFSASEITGANVPRVESIKKSIQEKGFNPLGLPHINARTERDHPYLLRYSDGMYRDIAGRVGRTLALKSLRAEGRMSRVEIFALDPVRYPGNFKSMVESIGEGGFQKMKFADENLTVIGGRDDIENDYWHKFCVQDYFWLDKTVLDVACNAGAWSFMALEKGSSKVTGFDVNSPAIDAANKVKDALSLRGVNFSRSSFEDYRWDRKFDVAFLNQCIYHFKLAEGEAFQRISGHADFLFMYTFMTHEQNGKPELGTYIPTVEKLKKHLAAAGYANTFVIGPKSVIDAMRCEGKYGGKIYIISFKNNIAPDKMKYFGFDVNLLKKTGFSVGAFSPSKVPFTQWWLDQNQLQQYVIKNG